MRKIWTAALASSALAFGLGHAALMVDETDPEIGGDYENLFADLDPTNDAFDVMAGDNMFLGSIVTPGDQGDTINLNLTANQFLMSVTLDSTQNATPFNPISINQDTVLSVFEFDDTPLIADRAIGGAGLYTLDFGPTGLMGGQMYQLSLISGVLALLDGAVDYKLTATVREIAPPPPPPGEVPVPAAALLFGPVLAGLGLRARKKRAA